MSKRIGEPSNNSKRALKKFAFISLFSVQHLRLHRQFMWERRWSSYFHSYLMCAFQVTDSSIPKVSALNNWQELLWSVVFIIAPIGALNNADSGVFVWIVGLTTFTYFCAKYMWGLCYHFHMCFWLLIRPELFDNFMINSNPSREYRVIFALNMTIILFFILVFSFEWFCALRRRIVAIRNGESAAEELHPRWFTIHRCSPKMIRDTLVTRHFACRFKRFEALVKMLLTNRSVLEVRTAFFYDLIDLSIWNLFHAILV